MKNEILGVEIITEDVRAVAQIETVVFKLLFGFASLSEVNFNDTIALHNSRCKQIAEVLLENLNYSDLCADDKLFFQSNRKVKYYLAISCALHDLGKTTVPQNILLKPSSLTEAELKVMKSHTTKPELEYFASAGLDGNIFVNIMRECIRSHHENYNGEGGYPDNLCGTDIPFAGRLMKVIDVLDNLVTDAVYRKALQFEEAYQEMLKLNGIMFDPVIIDSLMASKEQVRQIVSK
ncbi:HD domain-containing protein [Vibrio parahaemolyticus]|uniref:HD domain-containing protein n=1 Tax=Vibrio parahaemolyticus TaxID=670 RepID=A0A9Q3YHP9_VIBPH|nr:HD domain-containing phosphohydrolase [Vibrio parahaemolyticus]MCC3803787.1 HD domain-containing protein [Vibrio parahaemolyticus]